jgi:hypothetical protein
MVLGNAGDADRGRSQASRRADRHDRRAAHLRLGSHTDLAKHELGHTQTSIQDALQHFPNILAADMTIMTEPIQEIREAIEAKSRTKFGKAFENVTAACNSCHTSANADSIVVRVPRTWLLRISRLRRRG